jgi:hypothetical protein
VSAIDQATLVTFMDNGGSVYMEGANAGQSHSNTDFFSYFGADYVGPGSNNVISTLSGEAGTFAANSTFGYPDGDPDYSIDILDAAQGALYLTSQDSYGRGVYYDTGSYRTIITSPILGAFNESEQFCTRKFLMMEYVAFLSEIEGPELIISADNLEFTSYSPGEDVTQSFTVNNHGYLDLEIWDIQLEGDDEFFLDTPAPITIPAQESEEIQITFRSFETGSFSGYLIFISNDLDHQDELVTLSGECLLPPDIYIDQTQFDVVMGTDEETNLQLTLYNYGASVLEYSVWFDDQICWLDIPDPSGTVPVDDNSGVFIYINTIDMTDGEYSTELIINSNDPYSSVIFIQVNLTVITVDENNPEIPSVTTLHRVYPNPFNPLATFQYRLAASEPVNICIYNTKGQLVEKLVDQIQSAGTYYATWQADDSVSSVYFYRFTAGKNRQQGKILLLK